jgi:hypothetical protein
MATELTARDSEYTAIFFDDVLLEGAPDSKRRTESVPLGLPPERPGRSTHDQPDLALAGHLLLTRN